MKAPGSMTLAATEKGYITKSRFHEYGLAFIRYLKANGLADKTNLLILDGHKSQLYNLSFYETMRANNVEIFTIPPHSLILYNHSIRYPSHSSKNLGKTI